MNGFSWASEVAFDDDEFDASVVGTASAGAVGIDGIGGAIAYGAHAGRGNTFIDEETSDGASSSL